VDAVPCCDTLDEMPPQDTSSQQPSRPGRQGGPGPACTPDERFIELQMYLCHAETSQHVYVSIVCLGTDKSLHKSDRSTLSSPKTNNFIPSKSSVVEENSHRTKHDKVSTEDNEATKAAGTHVPSTAQTVHQLPETPWTCSACQQHCEDLVSQGLNDLEPATCTTLTSDAQKVAELSDGLSQV
jgi:hypothetical protein